MRRHEGQQPTHAVPSNEVRIRNNVAKRRIRKKIGCDDDLMTIGVGQRRLRSQVRSIRSVVLGRIDELALNGEPGTGSTDGHSASDRTVDVLLDRRTLPEVDVIRLVSARDEDRGCFSYFLRDNRIICRQTVRDYKGCDGIDVTKLADVGVIGVRSRGTDNQEVSASREPTHPFEGGIEVFPATYWAKPPRSPCMFVL